MPQSDELSTPPRDFDELKAAIVARRSALPRRLTDVAGYALGNPDEMAFGTAAGIAAAAQVQPSTLVRFAQQFGFDGFSSLQKVFRDRLRERNSSYEERLRLIDSSGAEARGSLGLLDGFIDAGQRSLDGLRGSVEADTFERAVALLAGARTIYLIARRRSYPIAAYMAYAFGKLRVQCVSVGTAAGIDDDLLALAGPEDAGFVISFSPYAVESVAQARAMAARGVPVVALTDSGLSPLAEHATVWFEVAEADQAGFRSLSASLALAMALTVGVAETRRHRRGKRARGATGTTIPD